MKFSYTFLSLLAAGASSLAAPVEAKSTVFVQIQNLSTDVGRGIDIPIGKDGLATKDNTVYEQITVFTENGDPLRCKVLNSDGKAVVATRGANTDITFSGGSAGRWLFRKSSVISKIICDPSFKADPIKA